MSAPETPSPTPATGGSTSTSGSTSSSSSNSSDSNKKFMVYAPWTCSSLKHPNDAFPEVTPKGVEMTGAERDAAKAAAKAARIVLRSEEVK